jgi:thiol-disulfide isomerase/thioredoxin
MISRTQKFSLAVLLALASSTALLAQNAAGRWLGTADYNTQKVPFRLEISGSGDQVKGTLVNGPGAGKEKFTSSSGDYSGGHLLLTFDYYANTIDATIRDGVLTGTFGSTSKRIPITARINAAPPSASPKPPRIAGAWEVAVTNGNKGEAAWDLHVRQAGAQVNAVIQRIDGDTGNLYGTWRDGQFEVSSFTADGPSFVVLKPVQDGTLKVITYPKGVLRELIARRPDAARAANLQRPDDPLRHTAMKDPNQPITFRASDLEGKTISSSDPQFKGKVVIVSVGGSWCPNCHDEAPFLESLYKKYHQRGLEIVELSFEQEDQLANPTRLKAFIRRYGITYPVLLAGTPSQLNEKLPQADGLNCWPTTFFIGRDGLVKAIHAGYSGPATGVGNVDLEKTANTLVLRLLSTDAHTADSVRGGN